MDPDDVVRISLQASRVGFSRDRCVAIAAGALCDECTESCWAALPSPGKDLLDDAVADRCTSCLSCVSACPTGAITRPAAMRATYAQLIDALSRGDEIGTTGVACGRSNAPPETSVAVACLHELGEGHLLYAAAMSPDDLQLARGRCEDCPAAPDQRTTLERRVARVNDLLGRLGTTRRVVWAPGSQSGESENAAAPTGSGEHTGALASPCDRRTALLMLRDQGSRAIGAALMGAIAPLAELEIDAHEERHPSQDRTVAIRGLARLLANEPGLNAEASNDMTGALGTRGPRVDSAACIGCGDCARFCPTGALRLKARTDATRIVLDTSTCVGCGLCAQLCRSNACRMVARPVSRLLGKPVRLVTLTMLTCAKCGDEFCVTIAEDASAQPRSLCPTCERAENRFPGFY